MEKSTSNNSSFSRRTVTMNRMGRLIDEKWKFIPFLAELEAAPKEYPRFFLWFHVFIDALQMLSISLVPEHRWGTAMTGFVKVLQYTQIPIFQLHSNTGFYVALSLAGFICMVYGSFFVYMPMRCILMKKYIPGASSYSTFVLKVYRHFFYLFSSVLFVPILQNFLAVAYRGDHHLIWFHSIKTSSVQAYFGLAFCCFGVISHVTAAVVMWVLFAESSFSSTHPLRRFNTTPDLMYVLYKLVCCVLYSHFWETDSLIGHSIWLMIANTCLLIIYQITLPLYDEFALKIRITMLWLVSFYATFAFTSHLTTYYEDHCLDIIIFFVTLPIMSTVFYRYGCLLRVSGMYKKSFGDLRQGFLTYPVVFYPKVLPRFPHLFTRNRALLSGIESRGYRVNEVLTEDLEPEVERELNARREYERETSDDPNDDPSLESEKKRRFALRHFVMPYISYIMLGTDIELSVRFLDHFNKAFPLGFSGYQLRYATVLYIKGIQKYEQSGEVHLAYVHFLVEQAQQMHLSVQEMQIMELAELSIPVSYRLWKMEVEVTKGLQVGIGGRLSPLTNVKQMHATSLQRVVELWHEIILEGHHGSDKVVEANRSLMRTRSVSRQDYENLVYSQPGNLEVLCCYAVFCDHLLGDQEMSKQCVQFITQFVRNREQKNYRGIRIQASLSAAVTQLKLSLENSRKAYHSIKQRSAVRLVHILIFVVMFLIIAITLLALIIVVTKHTQVDGSQSTIYYIGKLRTLSAQVALSATEIRYNTDSGITTSTSSFKTMYAYLYDFHAIFNSIVFGKESRTSADLNRFLANYIGGSFHEKQLGLWSYLSVAFGVMNSVLSSSLSTVIMDEHTLWLSAKFPVSVSTAATALVTKYIDQLHSDLKDLVTFGELALGAVLLLEIVTFCLLLYITFYVSGVRSLVFALMSLVPKAEIKGVYNRMVSQHGELDVFLKMGTAEKVNRLTAACETITFEKTDANGSLLRALFDVIPSGKGDGKFISLDTIEQLKEEKMKKAGTAAAEEAARKLEASANQSIRSSSLRYAVNDCFSGGVGSTGSTTSADDDGEENRGISDNLDDDGSPAAVKMKRRRERSRQVQAEYEGVKNEQAFLLSNDKNTMERLFTSFSIFCSIVIVVILAGLVVLNIVTHSKMSNVQNYNQVEINKHKAYTDAIYTVVRGLTSAAAFSVAGDQRYFKQYLDSLSDDRWEEYVKEMVSLHSGTEDSAKLSSFLVELREIYDGLFEITNIVMRLLCTTYEATCYTPLAPFDETLIYSLTWPDEKDLYMVHIAPAIGEYKTKFGLLEGSTLDLQKTAAEQYEMAVAILNSSILFNYIGYTSDQLKKMDIQGTNVSADIVKWSPIISIILSGVGIVMLFVEFFYNYGRKRGGRSLLLQVFFTFLIFGSFVAVIVLSAVNIKKNETTKIDDVLNDARFVFNKWSVQLFQLSWFPIMYILTYRILWVFRLTEMSIVTSDSLNSLVSDLAGKCGYYASDDETFALAIAVQLPLISSVLIYEATNALPAVADDSKYYVSTTLDDYTWDFTAESDYLATYAKYYGVTAQFYSTRATDLALSDADKISLAIATDVSFRTDDAWEDVFTLLLGSSTQAVKRYNQAVDSSQTQDKCFEVAGWIMLGAACVLIISNLHLFGRYCVNMVSTRHVATVTVGEKKVEPDPDAKPGEGADVTDTKEASLSVASPTHTEQGSISASDLSCTLKDNANELNFSGKLDDINIEVQRASQSVTSNVLQEESRSIMEAVETSSEGRYNTAMMIACFASLIVCMALTVASIMLIPLYSTHVLQYVRLIDVAGERRFRVVDSMIAMLTMYRDKSQYAVTSMRVRSKYDTFVEGTNDLYFSLYNTHGNEVKYGLVNLDKKLSKFLFSRNSYYNGQVFLGSDLSSAYLDGIQISTDAAESQIADFQASKFFCSYSDLVSYSTYYSRGVGLLVDGVWPDFMRRCFLYNYTICEATYSDASSMLIPLLIGLAEANLDFLDYVHNSSTRIYVPILLMLAAVMLITAASYLCLVIPYMLILLQEEADARMLVKILPEEVRSRYPVFREIIDGNTMVNESNDLHRVMLSISNVAVVAVDARDGSIIRFNENAEEVFGYVTSDILGKPMAKLMSDGDEDNEITMYTRRVFKGAQKMNSQSEPEELLMKRSSGELFSASVRFVYLRLSTNDKVVVLFVEPIADRMRLSTLTKINQAVFDMHQDAIIRMDSEGIILQANHACMRMFGWEPEHLIRQNVSVLMLPEIGQYHDEYLRHYFATGDTKRIDQVSEVVAVHRNGSLVKLHLLVKVVRPPYPNEPTQFIGYLRDRSTEKDLEHARSMVEVLNAISPVPLVQTNAKGEVQGMSRTACELFQYRQADLEQYTVPIQLMVPENIDGHPQTSFIQRSQMIGASSAVAQKRDRATFPAVLTVREIEFGAGIPYNIFVGYISDISRTLRLEKNGRMVLAVMNDGLHPVMLLDMSGMVTFFNTAAVKCFGYTLEEVMGTSYQGLCAFDDVHGVGSSRDWLLKTPTNSMEQGAFNRRRVVYAKRKNGDLFPAEIVLTHVPPINENDAAVVVALRDLTEEFRLQRNYHMSELIDLLCPQGLVVVNRSGVIERFSPAGEECFGYHAGEVVGSNIRGLIPGILLDGVNGSVNSKNTGFSSNPGNTSPDLSIPFIGGDKATLDSLVGTVNNRIMGRHFDARTIHLSIHAASLHSAGALEKLYVLYCENISNDGELQESSQFYQSVKECVETPLLQVDEEGVILYCNAYTVSTFGYASEGELKGKAVQTLFVPHEADSVVERLKRSAHNFHQQRTRGGVTAGDGSPKRGAAVAPVKTIVRSETVKGSTRHGDICSVRCTVVQVSSFLNGTTSFIMYLEPCLGNTKEQATSNMNDTLIQISSIPIVIADALYGSILHASPCISQMFGYERLEGILGANVSSLVNTSANALSKEYSRHETSPNGSKAMRTAQMGIREDGSTFHVEVETRMVGKSTEQPLILLAIRSTEQEYTREKNKTVLSNLLELMHVPVVVTDYCGTILSLNAPFLTLLGYEKTKDLLIGKDIGKIMTEEDAKYHRRYLTTYLSSGVKFSIDHTRVRKALHSSGAVVYVNTTIREVVGVTKDPKDTMFVGYLTPAAVPTDSDDAIVMQPKDVTTRTEKGLLPVPFHGRQCRSVEQWLRDEHGLSFALLSKEGKILSLSRNAERLLGFSEGEALGRPLWSALDGGAKSSESEVKQALQVIGSTTNAEYTVALEATNRRGTHLFLTTSWKELSAVQTKILKGSEELPQSVCYLFNTSVQLASMHNKQLCDAAVNACTIPTIFMSEDSIIRIFNPAAERVLGWPAKEVIGTHVRVLMPRRTAEMHDRFIQSYLQTRVSNISHGGREVIGRREDGTYFSATIRTADVQQPAAHFFVGQLEDISERKKDEVFAAMSRIVLKQTSDGVMVFNNLNELLLVSRQLVNMLGFEEEATMLSQPGIRDAVFTPNTIKIFKEFLQPFQRQATVSAERDVAFVAQFAELLQSFDQQPHKQIPNVVMRGLGGRMVTVDLDLYAVGSEHCFVGTIIRAVPQKKEAIEDFRRENADSVSLKLYPNPVCIVGANGKVERCNNALAEQLGYEDVNGFSALVNRKPFWTLFPSFPAPKGAVNLQDESKLFCGTMLQIVEAVERGAESDTKPVLRARMSDQSAVVLEIHSVTIVSNTGDAMEMPIDVSRVAFFVVVFNKARNLESIHMNELEETVDPLIMSCAVPIVMCEESGVIHKVNPCLEQVFDFTAEQLVGQSINLLMPQRVAVRHDNFMNAYMFARDTRPLAEHRRVMAETRTGKPLPIEIYVKEMIVRNKRYFIATVTPVQGSLGTSLASMSAPTSTRNIR